MNERTSKALAEAKDHLRVADKLLLLIEQMSHGAASCDHELVNAYAKQAMSRLQAAERELERMNQPQ